MVTVLLLGVLTATAHAQLNDRYRQALYLDKTELTLPKTLVGDDQLVQFDNLNRYGRVYYLTGSGYMVVESPDGRGWTLFSTYEDYLKRLRFIRRLIRRPTWAQYSNPGLQVTDEDIMTYQDCYTRFRMDLPYLSPCRERRLALENLRKQMRPREESKRKFSRHKFTIWTSQVEFFWVKIREADSYQIPLWFYTTNGKAGTDGRYVWAFGSCKLWRRTINPTQVARAYNLAEEMAMRRLEEMQSLYLSTRRSKVVSESSVNLQSVDDEVVRIASHGVREKAASEEFGPVEKFMVMSRVLLSSDDMAIVGVRVPIR